MLGQQVLRLAAEGCQRVVVQFGPGHHGHVLVQQLHHLPGNAGFGLATQAEQQDVVPRQNGGLQLRNDGFIIAQNAGEDPAAVLQGGNQVVAELVFDRFGRITAALERTQGGRQTRRIMQGHRVRKRREGRKNAALQWVHAT